MLLHSTYNKTNFPVSTFIFILPSHFWRASNFLIYYPLNLYFEINHQQLTSQHLKVNYFNWQDHLKYCQERLMVHPPQAKENCVHWTTNQYFLVQKILFLLSLVQHNQPVSWASSKILTRAKISRFTYLSVFWFKTIISIIFAINWALSSNLVVSWLKKFYFP